MLLFLQIDLLDLAGGASHLTLRFQALMTGFVLSQGVWLGPAYFLEFEGYNTFTLIWLAGLVFLMVNCFVLIQIINHYRPRGTPRRLKAE